MSNPSRNFLPALPRPVQTAIALLAWAVPLTPLAAAQTAQPAITLENSAKSASAALEKAPALPDREFRPGSRLGSGIGYRDFGTVKATQPGTSSEPQFFTFHFHQTMQLTHISSQGDFHVAPGGSCTEGHTYVSGDRCSVAMVFTPQAPGYRSGKLVLSHTASAQPLITPVGGTSYASAVNFVPALISTLPSTVNNGVGQFGQVYALAMDGGDTLYVSDIQNQTVSFLDPTGNLAVLAGGGSNPSPTYTGLATAAQLKNPWGIATDYAGDVFIADEENLVVRQVDPAGVISTVLGGGANGGPCTESAPCNPKAQSIGFPTGLATDPSGNLFALLYNGSYSFAELALASGTTHDFYYLSSAHLASTGAYAIAVDASDDLYYFDNQSSTASSNGTCVLYGQNPEESLAETPGARTWTVAGDRGCGYSGDGGPATGAQIGDFAGQFAWDAAGNFYFTDTDNQVVRRIDALTGIVHTIAGTGYSGYSGDGGPATGAAIWNSDGVAVDSAGNVYIGSQATNASTVIRKIGGAGQIAFPATAIGIPSAAQTVLVTDTGSAPLNLAHATFTSGNTADFALDPVTTNCSFTAPLYPGQSCKIGVIFTPTATGDRFAVLTLTDDTIAGNDIIQVSGLAGATPAKAVFAPASLTFPAQLVGTNSAFETVTLTNSGGLPLGLGTQTLIGVNRFEFSGYSYCSGATLAPGASCQIQLEFTPSAAGPASAALSIATPLGVETAALTGTGVLNASLVPAVYSFAPQTLGTTSAALTVKLINSSLASIGITSFTKLAGTGFTATAGTCAATLAANTSCTYSVTFSPILAEPYSATFSVVTSAGTVSTAIAGTGVINMSLSPSTVNFPNTAVGVTSAALTFKLTNSATVPLTLINFSITGSQFNPGNSCGSTVAAGGSCSFTVTFTPSYVGSIETQFAINTGRGPIYAEFIGTGIPGTPKVMIASAVNPAVIGQTVTLHSTVGEAGKESPTGTVELLEGATVLAKTTLSAGKASFELAKLTPGKHVLVAHYLGDKLHNPSSSSPLDQVIDEKAAAEPVHRVP